MMNTPCVGIHGCGNASESYGVPAGLQRVVLLGVLTAAASAVQIAEAPIPRLLPWLKPGLANALVLFSLIRLSPGFAWRLAVAKTIVTGIILGTLMTPAGMMSLAGAIASTGVMSLALSMRSGGAGLSGISVLGAVAHNLAQLAVVSIFAGGGLPILLQLSLLLGAAVPSGLAVAAVTHHLLRRSP